MARIAAIQMTSTDQRDANLATAAQLLRQAADKGAQCIVLPENFALLGQTDQDKLAIAEPYQDGIIQSFLHEQARQLHCWIVGGTIPIKSDDPRKVYATTLVYDAQGNVAARYDKIHLFDVQMNQGKEVYRESNATVAGKEIITLSTPFARMGVAVCYDVRFPELFRAMLAEQVEVIILPAAFTRTTGKVHWQTLLQARAIENLAYVVAADQWGQHNPGRVTYGHSMIVDPWGHIVDVLPSGEGVVYADIDLAKLQTLRETFPALTHRRL